MRAAPPWAESRPPSPPAASSASSPSSSPLRADSLTPRFRNASDRAESSRMDRVDRSDRGERADRGDCDRNVTRDAPTPTATPGPLPAALSPAAPAAPVSFMPVPGLASASIAYAHAHALPHNAASHGMHGHGHPHTHSHSQHGHGHTHPLTLVGLASTAPGVSSGGVTSVAGVSGVPQPPGSPVAPVNIPAQALSPPTPAPSPTPTERRGYAPLGVDDEDDDEHEHAHTLGTSGDKNGALQSKDKDDKDKLAVADLMSQFRDLPKDQRFAFLSTLIGELQLNEALVVSSKISPRLKRDFLADLPVELALHCVSFIDDPRTLGRAMRVSKCWHELLQDERLWRDMHDRQLFRPRLPVHHVPQPPPSAMYTARPGPSLHSMAWKSNFVPSVRRPVPRPQTFRERFRDSYLTESNWLHGGRLLTMHQSMGDTVVTSLVVNDDFIVIGMANSKIHVFDAVTGHYYRSLIGHEQGVWALVLVSPRSRDRSNRMYEPTARRSNRSSRRASFTASDSPSASSSAWAAPTRSSSASSTRDKSRHNAKRMRSSDVCGSATSWSGIKRTLVVSGGCDREVRVWDIESGKCLFRLRGHTSTIRCLKVLDGRPVAVSGSRDYTLRVWDIENGKLLRTLRGHEQSARCIEVAGNQVVSGSYDHTCRLWDIDTGECLQVFEGHYHQIYAVAFDGERVVSGSLDSTVRVWDAASGECLAILQGHTSLVGQLQLSGDRLITGGSDGRVIVFDLNDYTCVHRLCAHDNSVTCLQFDDRFIISGGNDGRVKLWDIQTGMLIRELTTQCDAVWRVCFRDDKCAILCQRNRKTVLEVIGFRPQDEQNRATVSRTSDW